jgi:hypothetical protein
VSPATAGRIACALLLAIAAPQGARAGRDDPPPYCYSLEVTYGEQPSRTSYLEEAEHRLEVWLASRGRPEMPKTKGDCEFHLKVVFHRILIRRVNSESLPQPQRSDQPTTVARDTYDARFDTEILVLDPQSDDLVVVTKKLTAYNQQTGSRFVLDPRARAWETNLYFLADRIEGFLRNKRRALLKYLGEQGRLPSAAPGAGP